MKPGSVRDLLARHRFGATLALVFALQLLVIGVFLLATGLDLDDRQRALWDQVLSQSAMLLAVLALLLLFALGAGLRALLNAYPLPAARLAEDAALTLANPAHRAEPQGAQELRALAGRINLLAAARQALQHEVQARIDEAGRALAEEKNRLAALMSELALAVLVCNIEGRILLYNARAKQLLGAGQEPGRAPIGLGRSLFGAVERGLIVHALEQIQYQLQHPQDGDATHPVSRFVATLAGGRMARAHMAPVLGNAGVLDGFVLTLEDITRTIDVECRRDALLQALTQGTRAALANVRAAVEAMLAFPGMSLERRAQFIAIIDAESQRLADQTERAVRQYGDILDMHWQLEDMRGADLVEMLQRRFDAAGLHAACTDAIDATLWIRADSYILAQALTWLGQRLQAEAGIGSFRFGLQRAGRLAYLDLAWAGHLPGADALRAWEALPVSAGIGADLTLGEVIARHGGESVYRLDAARDMSAYRLLLPLAKPQAEVNIMQAEFDPPQTPEGRPEFYDFDLFHQPGQNAQLDQCLLAQLSYTVFDTETTGLNPGEGDEIISIGAVRIVNGRLLHAESFEQLVQPRRAPGPESIGIHGITGAMLAGQPGIEKVLPRFHHFAEDTILVAHNAAFDMRFLQLLEARTGVAFTQPVLDTLLLSQVIHPNQPRHTLEAIAQRLGVAIVGRHTALGDAIVAGEVFLKMIPLLAEKDIVTLKDARDAAQRTLYARIRY